MKRYSLVILSALSLSLTATFGQDLPTSIQAMKNSYAASGSIVVLDKSTIVIEPKMPAPLCALPKNQDGKTSWSFYTFPLASITVPLAEVDETLISEDRVFTDLNVTKTYKPGDVGDTTMVVVAVVPGKQFHTLLYDRDKFTRLGPGPHSSSEYGQAPDDTEAFALTFSDPAAARTFEIALKDAVILARARTAHP
jgi:hypothetical protein